MGVNETCILPCVWIIFLIQVHPKEYNLFYSQPTKTYAPGPQFFTLKFKQLSTSAQNYNINLGQSEKTCNNPTTSHTKMESQFKPRAVHKLKKPSQEGT